MSINTDITASPADKRDFPAFASRGSLVLLTSDTSGTAYFPVIKEQSPEPRRVRIQPQLDGDYPLGCIVFVKVEHGVDSGITIVEMLVPAQGLTVNVPAGWVNVSVRRIVNPTIQQPPDLTTPVNIAYSIAAGYCCNRRQGFVIDTGWQVFVFPILVQHPKFATVARYQSVGNGSDAKITYNPDCPSSTTFALRGDQTASEPSTCMFPALPTRIDNVTGILSIEWDVTE